jgi:Ser/Thr protein kinase RdoA (MazF antagonist)
MSDDEAAARTAVETALVTLGLRATSMELVSPLGPSKGMRFAYRVATADGQTVKARHLGTTEYADDLCALRCHLDPAFAPVLDRSGAVIVEEWIPGSMLDELDPTPWFEPAGALLGRLHDARPDEGETSTVSWTEAARSDLALLEDAHELTATEAGTLRDRLHAADPGTARLGLTHKDFCADNIVIDTAGALRVIDNELLAIDPIGFDLGRTFHLWPMSDDARTAFDRGYRSVAPCPVEAVGYWRIVATLVGGRVFLTRSRVRLDEALQLLRRYADGDFLAPPP